MFESIYAYYLDWILFGQMESPNEVTIMCIHAIYMKFMWKLNAIKYIYT